MNQGFFGFSGVINDLTNIKAQEFDSSGSFVIPPFAKRIYVLLIGAGGGGGSGARIPSGTLAIGGGGGGGGRILVDDFPVHMFGPPGTILNIKIGAPGAAVSGASTNNTSGTAGNPGGTTTLEINGKPGIFLSASGGNAGGAGAANLGGGGASPQTSWAFGNQVGAGGGGGNGSSVDFPQGPGGTLLPNGTSGLWNWQSNGGCGGGGVSSGDTGSFGGSITAGGAFTAQYSPRYTSGNNVIQGGSPDTPEGGKSSYGSTIAGQYSPGLGGVGGGGGKATAGGQGSDGFRGGGGGGGGSARDGFNGGTGGVGGNGYCAIIAYG